MSCSDRFQNGAIQRVREYFDAFEQAIAAPEKHMPLDRSAAKVLAVRGSKDSILPSFKGNLKIQIGRMPKGAYSLRGRSRHLSGPNRAMQPRCAMRSVTPHNR